MEPKEYISEDEHTSSSRDAHIAILERSKLFRDMPESLIRHAASNAIDRHMRHGEALFMKHDPEDFIAIVVAGCIHTVLYGPEGRELIIHGVQPGDVVGETALIDFRRRDTSAFACGPTRVLILRRRHFSLLTAEPLFINRVLALLCTRLCDVVALIESVCLYRLESRLARYFVSVVDEVGRTEPGGTVVPMPSNQSILAAMVNASRPKLNAQLQAWRRSGLVSWTHDTLLISDVDQLRYMAHVAA